MVARGDIFWAGLGPPAGRGPVCVLTRDAAIRGIRSEVLVGPGEGLPEDGVVTCDNIVTIPKATLDTAAAVGRVGMPKRAALDRALRYALDTQY